MGLKAKLATLEGLAPELHNLYVKQQDGTFLLDAEGVEDVGGLKTTLQAERDARKLLDKQIKDLTDKYKGIDPDQARQILSRFANDEEAQLIAAGKVDEVIEKRTEKLRTELQHQVEEANKGREASEARAKRYEQRVLDDQIRAAAMKAGVHSTAVEDALFRGRSMFSLDAEGRAVQLGDDGKPVLGKDGKSAFAPEEWLTSMKDSAPHWFPAKNSGGGAGGAHLNGRGGPDISSLPPAERLTAARQQGRA